MTLWLDDWLLEQAFRQPDQKVWEEKAVTATETLRIVEAHAEALAKEYHDKKPANLPMIEEHRRPGGDGLVLTIGNLHCEITASRRNGHEVDVTITEPGAARDGKEERRYSVSQWKVEGGKVAAARGDEQTTLTRAERVHAVVDEAFRYFLDRSQGWVV